MKKKYLLGSLFVASQLFYSQSSDIIWSKTYGGSAQDIIADNALLSNGNFAVIGMTYSSGGDVQNNPSGAMSWLAIGDSNSGEFLKNTFISAEFKTTGKVIKQTSDGGIIIVGDNMLSSSSCYISKLDESGNIIWKKEYEGFETMSLALCQDGGYFVVDRLGWIKFDSNGNEVNKNRSLSIPSGFGIENANGELILVYPYQSGFKMHKLSKDGAAIWEKYILSSISYLTNLIQTKNGHYVVVGAFNNGSTKLDEKICRIDGNGDLVWDKAYGGSEYDIAHKVIEESNGDLLISGDSFSSNGNITNPKGGWDAWLIKLTEQGNLIWERSYGGSKDDGGNFVAYGTKITKLSDGNYILSSHSKSNNGDVSINKGDYDYWVFKIKNPDLNTKENEGISIKAFPNPIVDQLEVVAETDINKVRIFDSAGRIVLDQKIENKKNIKINAKDFSKGIYFVSVHTSSANKVMKIIKN